MYHFTWSWLGLCDDDLSFLTVTLVMVVDVSFHLELAGTV